MRKVFLKRKFSIIECGSKIMLYVECEKDNADVEIDGVYCKELGKVKNGKVFEFEIGENETKIFLLSSTMDCEYKIPAGSQDVKLVAFPKYNPFQGNPFTIIEDK